MVLKAQQQLFPTFYDELQNTKGCCLFCPELSIFEAILKIIHPLFRK